METALRFYKPKVETVVAIQYQGIDNATQIINWLLDTDITARYHTSGWGLIGYLAVDSSPSTGFMVLRGEYVVLHEGGWVSKANADSFLATYEPIKDPEPELAQWEKDLQNEKPVGFQNELSVLINKHSQEELSNTPDFILAEYLQNCLAAFNQAQMAKDAWNHRG